MWSLLSGKCTPGAEVSKMLPLQTRTRARVPVVLKGGVQSPPCTCLLVPALTLGGP